MDLLQDYKNIVYKIKEHIKTELEKRYDDIKFDDDDSCLLCFNIGCWYFEIDITNNDFRMICISLGIPVISLSSFLDGYPIYRYTTTRFDTK